MSTVVQGWVQVDLKTHGMMDKYRDRLVVVVAGGKSRAINLMPKVIAALGNPERIAVFSRGSNLAFANADKIVNVSGLKVGKQEGSFYSYIAGKTLVANYGLQSGVYECHVENEMVVFDTSDTPSQTRLTRK